jgi:AcrR family transcriptional regulator
MVRTTAKGERTRQRIVELAAPVFNRQGYVGASMRDLIDATGLEKGGIYNHFGSKEQLALEAYDYAMSRVTNALARSQDGATDAPDRLVRMIRAFAMSARSPAIEGGCPIMNTAIEADDGHKAEGTLRGDIDPYALASTITASLEGALMLSRLYDDPKHMDHVVAHLVGLVDTLRATKPPRRKR